MEFLYILNEKKRIYKKSLASLKIIKEKKEISHKLLVEKNPLQNKLQKIINYSKKDGVFNVF